MVSVASHYVHSLENIQMSHGLDLFATVCPQEEYWSWEPG